MIIVTGGDGFIGTHLVERLAEAGHKVLAVNGAHGTNCSPSTWSLPKNIFLSIMDVQTLEQFFSLLRRYIQTTDDIEHVTSVIHLGACSDTLNDDWKYLGTNNYEYSTKVFQLCQQFDIPLIYASSAATYGRCKMWTSSKEEESLFTLEPLNKYGWSKLLFDQYVDAVKNNVNIGSRWHGLRFFNVYGKHEAHKGRMSSMPWKFIQQGKEKKIITIYDVEAYRDFIYVEDVVDVIWYMIFNPCVKSGIYNVGSGTATNVKDVATIAAELTEASIIVAPTPEKLLAQYQYFTQADMLKLRGEGYLKKFTPVKKAMDEMCKQLG